MCVHVRVACAYACGVCMCVCMCVCVFVFVRVCVCLCMLYVVNSSVPNIFFSSPTQTTVDSLLLPSEYERVLRFILPAREKCVLLCTRVVLELGRAPASVVFDWPIELLQVCL